jgi:hypothetical protein
MRTGINMILSSAKQYARLFFIIVLCPWPVFGSSFDTQKSEFEVQIKDIVSPYRIMSFSFLPEETVPIKIITDNIRNELSLSAEAGHVTAVSRTAWNWKAPKKTGTYDIRVFSHDQQIEMTLHCFVILPYSSVKKSEYINGYRMGNYPVFPFKGLPIYNPPAGFIEVTPNNIDLPVSPHFKLSQFTCKQSGEFPKYMVLQTRLLLKLELILEHVNKNGYYCDTFHVMSGYRTPFYNKSIGNVKYSRHLWGGAADIFIDESPKNAYMDDLNRDGVINWKDAQVLYKIIDGLYGKPFYDFFIGGLAWYRKTSVHAPFVHVDVRRYRARWEN